MVCMVLPAQQESLVPVLLIPCNPQTIPKQSPNNHVVWICLIWGRLWVIKFSDFSTTLCNFRTTHTSPGCSTQCATLQTSYSSPSKKCRISLAVSILGAVVYSQPGPGEILEAASVPICPFLEFASLHCFQDQKPLTVRERQESCDSLKFVKLIYVSLPCLWQQKPTLVTTLTTTTTAKLVRPVSLDGRWGNPSQKLMALPQKYQEQKWARH